MPIPLTLSLLPPPPSTTTTTSNSIRRGTLTFKPLTTPHTTTTTKPSSKRPSVDELKSSTDLESTLSRLEHTLQVQDLNIVLRHFGELRKWHQVSQIFDWMRGRKKLNFATYSGFIKYMGLSGNFTEGMQVYESIPDKSLKVNVSICNAVLGCMMRNGRFESCMKLFDEMKDDGLSPNLVTYSTLLAGCAKVKTGYSKAMQLVQELRQQGLKMDGVVYGTLLAICASNNLCEEAEGFFHQMKDECCLPNVFHYSSLLNAYSIDGNYLKAEKLVSDMKSSGFVPNKVILTTLLKVYARGGLFEKSRDLLAELEALGYAGDEMPYCLLMDNLAKAGHTQEANEVFIKMREKQVKSDGYAYSIMITAFCRCGLLQEANQLAKDFEESYKRYDLVMLNTLLRAYCNSGDMASVMQLLQKMDELAISPDFNTFQTLVKYFCKENLYHLAYRTIEDMHKKGHQLDEELCTVLIIQLGQNSSTSEAFSVYNMLRYSKRTPCKSLHGKMLGILLAAGLLKEAYVLVKDNVELISLHLVEKFAMSFMKSGNINMMNDVLKACHRSGQRVSQEVFRMAILRYIAKPEKKMLLLHLLQWMAGQGYVVDSKSRNLLLKNSHLFGQKQLIAEILTKQHIVAKKLTIPKVKK